MENPNRRCTGNFSDKYLAGDVLKATCGAPIRVELMHRSTGDTPSNQDYKDIVLEVSAWPSPMTVRLIIGLLSFRVDNPGM